MRLTAHSDWKVGDSIKKSEKSAAESFYVQNLISYLLDRKGYVARVDDYLDNYPTTCPCKRGDFVKLIRRYRDYFMYDETNYEVHLIKVPAPNQKIQGLPSSKLYSSKQQQQQFFFR